MKYEISIEGGFAGFVKNYKGEVDLPELKENEIVNAMRQPPSPVNPRLVDGLNYRIRVKSDEGEPMESEFTETSLPETLREFVSAMLKKSRGG